VRLVALSGSLRPNAFSTAALRAGLEIARHAGAETELCDLREIDLPIFMPDASISSYPDPARERIADLAARYREADAMLWATPAYHGTMSGALKNALDYMQLLAADPAPYLQGKPVGLISIANASPHPHMAACATELRAWLAPTRLTLDAADFGEDLTIASVAATRRLQRLISELMQFAGRQP